jgi:hypothetical protein
VVYRRGALRTGERDLSDANAQHLQHCDAVPCVPRQWMLLHEG